MTGICTYDNDADNRDRQTMSNTLPCMGSCRCARDLVAQMRVDKDPRADSAGRL